MPMPRPSTRSPARMPISKDAIAKLKSYSDDLKSLYSQLKH
jgi:hypothetical protein